MPGRLVIIVDDNPIVRQALCGLFTRKGDFKVCGEAGNGQEAVEKAQPLQPDLNVTDFSMPVMNGLEEARVLKELVPDQNRQAFGSPSTNFATPKYSGFIQDHWTVTNRFTIDAGIRYDFEHLPAQFTHDTNDFTPRIGLAYSPSRSGH